MVRGWCALLSALLVAASFTPLLASPAAAPPVYAEETRTYVVAPGDTLWTVARRFGVTVKALAAANGLSNPDRIYVGQRLVIPVDPVAGSATPDGGLPAGSPPAVPGNPAQYTVSSGDTLFGLSRRFNVTVEALAQANGLSDPNRIFVGQELVIPGFQPSGPSSLPSSSSSSSSLSLLRSYRMVTYYGMAGKPTMGILGQLGPDELVRSLRQRAAAVAATGGKPVLPALQLVVAQAMRGPEADGTYRRRVDPATIQRYVDLAEANGLQIILDLQIGRSTVAGEMAALAPFLARPHVHLALDAEYAMPPGVVPGTQLGSLDAREINAAIQALARIVEQGGLPNKVLMIHQFRPSMITRRDAIVSHPAVDLTINMDGYGSQAEKIRWYHILLANQSVAFPSLQVFLRHDVQPFTAAEALALSPAPDVLVYF